MEDSVPAPGPTRSLIPGLAILAVAAASAYLVVLRMAGMGMSGGGLAGLPDFAATWSLMMAAMIMPSSMPAILARGNREVATRTGPATALRTAQFVVAFIAAWTLFGVLAHVARHWGPQGWVLVSRPGATLLLVGAGLYELTPLKRDQLRRCRAAGGGHATGLAAGLHYGGACVLSSAALMIALLLLAPNSLAWMVVVALVILAQKVAPLGAWAAALPVAVALLGLAVVVYSR